MSYRNHPGGMSGMSENLTTSTRPVVLEDVVATGNRAQRRFALRKLAEIHRKESAARRKEIRK